MPPDPTATDHAPEVRVLASRAQVAEAVLAEFECAVAAPDPLVCLATGGTFELFFALVNERVALGRLDLDRLRATHLDEYLAFGPDDSGGMVHELMSVCPPLRELLADDRFWPVPSDADAEHLAAHEARIAAAGGIGLQLLGIGRNGHIAFNEPGTSLGTGFHRPRLAEATRQDARPRFPHGEPPTEAISSGPRTILAARRVVLAATGTGKASAVRAMLRGPISATCPASAIRLHDNALVVLDAAAASELDDAQGAVS